MLSQRKSIVIPSKDMTLSVRKSMFNSNEVHHQEFQQEVNGETGIDAMCFHQMT